MGKQTTSTTIKCHVAIPSCDHDILNVISQLTDTTVQFEAAKEGGAVDLQVTSKNAFTKKTTESSAVSLLGCVRYLCLAQQQTELWDGEPAGGQVVESWIQASEQTLLQPILRNKQSQGDLLLETVQDFLEKIANHLGGGDSSSYLVGDSPTAADVCVAIPLAVIGLEIFTSLTWPDKTFAWMEAVLSQLDSVVEKSASMAWGKWKNLKTGSAAAAGGAAGGSAPASAPVSSSGDNKILNLLNECKLEYTLYDHPLSMTAEELVTNAPLPEGETHTKNLFLRDKKHGIFLVSVATNATHTTPVQTKELGKLIGLKGKTNLRLADEATLMEFLYVKPGCVGPLCAAIAKKDGEEKVTLVLDQSLTSYKKVHSHPMRNDQSVSMTPDDLMKCLQMAGVEPMMLDFGSMKETAGKAPANRPPESKEKPAQAAAPKKKEGGADKSKQAQSNKKTAKKGETLLALQWKKQENFPQWYSDVIVLSEMIAYYDISGCYILRPWSYKIWELMQKWFDIEVRDDGRRLSGKKVCQHAILSH